MIKAILFDLDGTLLPMRQDEFTKAYFEGLSRRLAPYGYDPQKLVAGVWQGTKAMVKNDGKLTNEKVFWKEFATVFGDRVYDDVEKFNEYYVTDFDKAQRHCGRNEQANKTIKALKGKGYMLVLASNPLFPIIAQKRRMMWAGVDPDDFALITSYENSRYCKPNPLYFKEIIDKLGVSADECLMVGNDTTEDTACMQVGLNFFLIPNCLLNKENKDISIYAHGSFEQLLDYVETLN